MKREYKVAIPSYKRAETLKEKTMKVLEMNFILPEKVYIFVADEEQKKEYESVLERDTYNEIVVGVPGMMAIRNFITDYFDEGEYIFCLDDDVSHFRELLAARKDMTSEEYDEIWSELSKLKEAGERIYAGPSYSYLYKTTSLDQYVTEAFEILEKENLHLFGFFTSDNSIGLSSKIKKGLYYVIGSNFGFINTKDIYVTLDDKEDFERCLKFYQRDGAIVRIDKLGPATNYYGEVGGMQEERTKERVELSAKILAEQYPDLCTAFLKESSKGEFWEVKFRSGLNRKKK